MADVEVRDGRVVAVGEVDAEVESIEGAGQFLVPAVIDSHVHLTYLPVADELMRNGVAGAVDLAAPMSSLAERSPIRLISAGPMITAVSGYPVSSWGRGGYGLEVAGPEAAIAAVEELHSRGARVIKVPITAPPVLDDATIAAVVSRAHELGLRVAVHALGDADALRAARLGADVLAHTPVQALSEETLEAWRGRAVIATLTAFGTDSGTLRNLSNLRARGVTVLYGTDLGNTRTPGIDSSELAAMRDAGLDGAAVLDAATRAPAEYWGITDLGSIEPGKAACMLLLAADPTVDPLALSRPEAVWMDGERRD